VLLNPGQPAHILTGHQVKNPPVGSRGAVFVEFAAPLAPPWKVLVMTDGVWKYAGWEEVLRIVAAEQGQCILSALQERARLARTGGLPDDFTAVLFQGSAG
jgi:hypothetical protein